MTPRFSMTPAALIFTFQMGSIILQTLALPLQRCYLCLIEVCITIYLNGIVPNLRKLFAFLKISN